MKNPRKKKEKIVTFRRYLKIEALPNVFTEDELKNRIIEENLQRGYIPINVKYERVVYWPANQVGKVEIDIVHCRCGFAGKKAAREFYEKNKQDLIDLENQPIKISNPNQVN